MIARAAQYISKIYCRCTIKMGNIEYISQRTASTAISYIQDNVTIFGKIGRSITALDGHHPWKYWWLRLVTSDFEHI